MGESWNKDKQWVWKEKGWRKNKGGKCLNPNPKSTLNNPKHENHRLSSSVNPIPMKSSQRMPKKQKQRYILVVWSTQIFPRRPALRFLSSCQWNTSDSPSCGCVPGRYLNRDWTDVQEEEERDSILTPLFHHAVLGAPTGFAARSWPRPRTNSSPLHCVPSSVAPQDKNTSPDCSS